MPIDIGLDTVFDDGGKIGDGGVGVGVGSVIVQNFAVVALHLRPSRVVGPRNPSPW